MKSLSRIPAGAEAGNYQTSCSVSQMGKTKPGGQFTGTVVLTLHDIGLNHFTNYATLFQSKSMEPVLEKFTCFHVDFPCMKPMHVGSSRNSSGSNYIIQTERNGAGEGQVKQWDKNLVYPSMDELAGAMLPAVMKYFNLHSVIIFGTGVGSNVGVRFSLKYPELVTGLISINPIHYAVGWSEWFWDKTSSLSNDKLREYILSYLFGPRELGTSLDIVSSTEQAIRQMDQEALMGFYTAMKQRTPIVMERPNIPSDKSKKTVLKCATCIIIGDWATNFMEDAMEMNSVINPEISNFVKLADAGAMVYEEQPTKVAESIKLFLQGLGYLSTVLPTRLHEQNSRRNEKLNNMSKESRDFEDMTGLQTTTFNNAKTVNDLI